MWDRQPWMQTSSIIHKTDITTAAADTCCTLPNQYWVPEGPPQGQLGFHSFSAHVHCEETWWPTKWPIFVTLFVMSNVFTVKWTETTKLSCNGNHGKLLLTWAWTKGQHKGRSASLPHHPGDSQSNSLRNHGISLSYKTTSLIFYYFHVIRASSLDPNHAANTMLHMLLYIMMVQYKPDNIATIITMLYKSVNPADIKNWDYPTKSSFSCGCRSHWSLGSLLLIPLNVEESHWAPGFSWPGPSGNWSHIRALFTSFQAQRKRQRRHQASERTYILFTLLAVVSRMWLQLTAIDGTSTIYVDMLNIGQNYWDGRIWQQFITLIIQCIHF